MSLTSFRCHRRYRQLYSLDSQLTERIEELFTQVYIVSPNDTSVAISVDEYRND